MTQPDIDVESLRKKNEGANAKLKDLQPSGENSWDKFKTKVR